MTKKIMLLLLLLWTVQFKTATAQQTPIKPFETGEKLPDLALTLHTGDSVTQVHLSDFSGKAVLLDFWGLLCTECIAGMPHLLDLQKRYGDRIKVILVCLDNEEDVRNFWVKAKGHLTSQVIDAFNHLPCVMGARPTLRKSFGTQGTPEQIWIDGNSVLRYRSRAETTTPENVEAFLAGERVHLREVYLTSQEISLADPLSWQTNAINFHPEGYSLITGYIPNSPTIFSYYKNEDSVTHKILGLSLLNKSILELYQTAWREKYKRPVQTDEIVLDVKDKGKYIQPVGSGAAGFSWAENNCYCYAKKIKDTSENIYDLMLADLDRYFGLRVSKENRRIKCYVLKRIPGKPLAPSKYHDSRCDVDLGANGEFQYQLKEYSMHEVVEILGQNIQQLLDPFAPILDETNYIGKVDLVFPTFEGSSLRGAALWKALNKALQPYDLTLEEENKTREVIVLHENGYIPGR